MDRIIPEKQAAIMVAYFGLVVGTAFGWNHLEAESQKQQLLARSDFLELSGAYTKMNSLSSQSLDYSIWIKSENDGYSFATSVNWERVTSEVERQNKNPVWRFSPNSIRGKLPGFIFISSEISVINSNNPEDVIIPKQKIEGTLFCPTIAVQELKSRILGIFPSFDHPKPNQDEIFRGVKET